MSGSRAVSPIAVIDVETTGLFPLRHDRVIEIAVVIIRPDGVIEREFNTLVNPERDIGPSSIHGLAASDVIDAPRFGEIAGSFLDALAGTVAIAAHNIRFDRQFLEAEFTRMGSAFPDCFDFCTMQLANGRGLAKCCDAFGIPFEGEAHHALTDARVAARLLAHFLKIQPEVAGRLADLSPICWPDYPRSGRQPMCRDESRRRQSEPPSFLQRLVEHRNAVPAGKSIEVSAVAYCALLDRILADRSIDAYEGDALIETANRWGLDGDSVHRLHGEYFRQLSALAVSDGVLTNAESRDLQLVAKLLGLDSAAVNTMLQRAASKVREMVVQRPHAPKGPKPLAGRRVCFTGELQCRKGGKIISRETAEELAGQAGATVLDGVTKKLDILVVADLQTQSGKARKARQYGIRIMHEAVFWKTIGVEVE
jgi:DNA polymerase-3 subunit epsilon